MLYICIFSNKFDLKQTIRVLHTGGQRFDGPRSVTKYDTKWIKSFTDWQHKNRYYDITFWKNGGVRKYEEKWRATGTKICVFTVSASTTDRKSAEPGSRMDSPVQITEEENTGQNDTRMKTAIKDQRHQSQPSRIMSHLY